jgi:hypothetical protein
MNALYRLAPHVAGGARQEYRLSAVGHRITPRRRSIAPDLTGGERLPALKLSNVIKCS